MRRLSCLAAIFLFFLSGPLPSAAGPQERNNAGLSKNESLPEWIGGVEESLRTLQLQLLAITRHELSFTGENNWPEYLPGFRVELKRRYDMFVSQADELLETLRNPPQKIMPADLKRAQDLLRTAERQARTLRMRPLRLVPAAASALPAGCDPSGDCPVSDCSSCCAETKTDPLSRIVALKNCGSCDVLRLVCALHDAMDKEEAAAGSH